jgi:hypothetical protein
VSQQLTDFNQQNVRDLLRPTGSLTHCRLFVREHVDAVRKGMDWLIRREPFERFAWQATIPANLDQEDRDRWKKILYHQGQTDLGLTRRGDRLNEVTQEKEDRKWIFHFKRVFGPLLLAKKLDQDPEAKSFIHGLMELERHCFAFCSEVARRLGLQEDEGAHGVIRLIWYDPVKSMNDIVAQSHWDRNTFTIHLDESQAGLWVPESDDYALPEPKMRLLHRATEDEVHLFASGKAVMAKPGELYPVWHRGMAPQVGVPRYVAVYFHHHTGQDLPEEFRTKSRESVRRFLRQAGDERVLAQRVA